MNRGFFFAVPPLTSFVKKLIAALFLAFVLELLGQNWLGLPIFETCALWVGPSYNISTLWALFTYVFIEPPQASSILRLIIGFLFLWLILSPFEERFGSRRTLQLCITCAMTSALCSLLPTLWLTQSVPLFGSTPFNLGGISALAISLRSSRLMLFGVFAMKGIHLLWLLIGYSVLVFLASANSVILCSSLGAIGGGVLFMWWIGRTPRRRKKSSNKKKPAFRVIQGEQREPPTWLN